MKDSFIEVVDYLRELQNNIDNQELNNEEKLLMIIKYAILTDNYYQGSIILTKENDEYRISNIQKYSYAWLLQGEYINLDYILNILEELNISYSLEYFKISNHVNDYELSFSIPKLKKRKVL